jgi:hypothetical protein
MRKTMTILALLAVVFTTGCTRADRRKVTRAVANVTRDDESEDARNMRAIKEALEDVNDEMAVVNAKADALSSACDDARAEFGKLCDGIKRNTEEGR